MFTGIIEAQGEVVEINRVQSNIDFKILSPISNELKIDQSIAHNGVCLTVVHVEENCHTVTAIDETLRKTNLGDLKIGSKINLERCTQIGGRLDGHIVQGHVDQIGTCIKKHSENGSWEFRFEYAKDSNNVTVEKGSICINGISLTVVNSEDNAFSVFIIPYTYENTNLGSIEVGDTVNLEFDIVGKYIAKLLRK